MHRRTVVAGHGRGGVCALIRSPLIGSVSHQQAVGQCARKSVQSVGGGRTGGNLPVCRQEREGEGGRSLLHTCNHTQVFPEC